MKPFGKRFSGVAAIAFGAATMLWSGGGVARAATAPAIHVNNLSQPGTMGKIRIRPVFQDQTGATVIQTGDPARPETNPNRTIGDAWLTSPPAPVFPYNTPGLRILGNNPLAGDSHTHYHAGDTTLLLNDVSGIEVGDTLLVGSPYCDFRSQDFTCKSFAFGSTQPPAQVVHVVGGDIPGTGPGRVFLNEGLTDEPQCYTTTYGACAINSGVEVVKLPTLYQGQQFRVDIPHWDLLNGSPNGVTVKAWISFPADSNNANPVVQPLTLGHDTSSTQTAVPASCGPPASCGLGFASFYIPKTITATATLGNTFSVDVPSQTWYTVYVQATDNLTHAVVSDGVARFKLNSVAIEGFDASPKQAVMGESVIISGFLRDNSSAYALANRPVEDVIADFDVSDPPSLLAQSVTTHYQDTSCVNTLTNGGDRCAGAHGRIEITFGGFQQPQVAVPSQSGVTACFAGFNPFILGSYVILVEQAPACLGALVASLGGSAVEAGLVELGTTIPGSYTAEASLRLFNPASTASTYFDVVPPGF